MTVMRQRALRAEPPDPGAEVWCERERDLVERALTIAHGMQGAPGWWDFVDYLLGKIESQYPDWKESVVRNEWRSCRELTTDEFEWGIQTQADNRNAERVDDLFCDECGTLSSNLYGFEATAVCEGCWETLGLSSQASLLEFEQVSAPRKHHHQS